MDVPTAAGLALGAAADRAPGGPPRWHPVAGVGAAAPAPERRTWRGSRAGGAAHTLALPAAAVATGAALDRSTTGRPLLRTAATATATWAVLGGTSLGRTATRLQRALDSA